MGAGLLVSGSLLAAEKANEPLVGVTAALANSTAGLEDSVTRVLSGLLLVIGLIILLAWLARRGHWLARPEGQIIQIIASQSIGPRERLVLVQLGAQQVLLGVSQGQITPLHVLPEPVPCPVAAPPVPAPDFARYFMEFMGRKDKDKP